MYHTNEWKGLTNHIFFGVIFAGPPEVTLQKVPPVPLNEFVKLKATIRGFPKEYKVDWLKGGQYINTTDPKYMGSMIDGSKSVLCIRNVGNDDNAVYTVRVENTCGKGESSERLEVIEGKKKKQLFISFYKEYIEVFTFLL